MLLDHSSNDFSSFQLLSGSQWCTNGAALCVVVEAARDVSAEVSTNEASETPSQPATSAPDSSGTIKLDVTAAASETPLTGTESSVAATEAALTTPAPDVCLSDLDLYIAFYF